MFAGQMSSHANFHRGQMSGRHMSYNRFFYFAGFGAQQSGTVVKFNPPNGQDTMVKNGVTQNINTKHQCITAMKEYESKSLEVSEYFLTSVSKVHGIL